MPACSIDVPASQLPGSSEKQHSILVLREAKHEDQAEQRRARTGFCAFQWCNTFSCNQQRRRKAPPRSVKTSDWKTLYFPPSSTSNPFPLRPLVAYHYLQDHLTRVRALNRAELHFFCGFIDTVWKNRVWLMEQGLNVFEQYFIVMLFFAHDANNRKLKLTKKNGVDRERAMMRPLRFCFAIPSLPLPKSPGCLQSLPDAPAARAKCWSWYFVGERRLTRLPTNTDCQVTPVNEWCLGGGLRYVIVEHGIVFSELLGNCCRSLSFDIT